MDKATRAPSPSGVEGSIPAGRDLSGSMLGDFQVLRRLGQGGMGQVYLAEQCSLRRRVALKILRSDLAANATALHRFKAEAEAVARATHANIVQVYATGESSGLHYMALEYVEGRNLHEYLARKGSPDLRLGLRIMIQVAAALQRASELGIVHRDIKPENILLTRRGEVKVADFGLSRCFAGDQQPLNLTQSGVTMGTPLYMSPEQVEGQPLDPRTDIYSFGVTCYHMFAGQPPFRGENAIEVALKHVRAEPEPLAEIRPDLPAAMCGIIHKMMAKEPAQRYQTCRELLKDLNRLQRDLVTQAPPMLEGSPRATEAAGLPGTMTAADYLMLSGEEELSDEGPRGSAVEGRRLGRQWRPAAAAVLSMTLALGAGAAIGWVYHRPPVEPSPSQEPTGSASAVEALFSQKKREQFLLEAVQQYANPGDDRDRLELGLKLCLELGLFYLQQEPPRLEEADAFFKRLMSNPHGIKCYATLGRLGHGLVLAFQDRAPDSNQLFLEVLEDPHAEKERFMNNPQLRYWIARALDYNAANLEGHEDALPTKLKPLREPPFPLASSEKPRRATPGKSP